MNVPQEQNQEETLTEKSDVVETEQPSVSPFTGLVTVGQLFPMNGVWCRVVKMEGPHIILTAVEYTSKIKRYINEQTKRRTKRG